MLSNLSEYELAKIFVYSKKEKIEKLLNIDELNTNVAADNLFRFICDNPGIIWRDSENKYNPIFDEVFFTIAINFFKDLQNQGINLSGQSNFHEPKVMFVS